MNTFIIYNTSNYDTLADALADGAGKVIHAPLDLAGLQTLLDDVTEYCCSIHFEAVPVRGQVARQLAPKENGE